VFFLHGHKLLVHAQPVSVMIRTMLRKYSGTWISSLRCSDHVCAVTRFRDRRQKLGKRLSRQGNKFVWANPGDLFSRLSLCAPQDSNSAAVVSAQPIPICLSHETYGTRPPRGIARFEEIRSCPRENLWRSPALSLASQALVASERFQLPQSSSKISHVGLRREKLHSRRP